MSGAKSRKERALEIVDGLERMRVTNPAGRDRLIRLLARLMAQRTQA